MPEAATLVATCSTDQMMFEMVPDRVATGVTEWFERLLYCDVESKLLFLDNLFPNGNKCELLPLEQILTLTTTCWLQRSAIDPRKSCFPEGKSRRDLEKLYAQRQKVQDTLEENVVSMECESENVKVQWNSIKICVLDTVSDLTGKVERRPRKTWITQEMISKMDERRWWKNVNNEERRKNYRRLRNDLKRATDKTKKEYLESICDESIEFQRTRRYDQMYMKTK
jgi:hypothetical protein